MLLLHRHVHVRPVQQFFRECSRQQEKRTDEVKLRHVHRMVEEPEEIVEHFKLTHGEYSQVKGENRTENY
jgi:hypothetical protein